MGLCDKLFINRILTHTSDLSEKQQVRNTLVMLPHPHHIGKGANQDVLYLMVK